MNCLELEIGIYGTTSQIEGVFIYPTGNFEFDTDFYGDVEVL